MPIWLQIAFGAIPGCMALVLAAMHLGAIKRDVHDLTIRAAGWDQARLDLSYIKGRIEGADIERLAPTSSVGGRRGTAARLKAVSD